MALEHQDAAGRFHPKVDYDTDFYAWAQAQAEALRAKDWAAVDVTNLLEEMEGLAERHRSAIEHQLERLLIHLLKYQYQPNERPRRGRGWRVSIASARHEIEKVIQAQSESTDLSSRLCGQRLSLRAAASGPPDRATTHHLPGSLPVVAGSSAG